MVGMDAAEAAEVAKRKVLVELLSAKQKELNDLVSDVRVH